MEQQQRSQVELQMKEAIDQMRFHPNPIEEHLGSGYDPMSDYDYTTCCNILYRGNVSDQDEETFRHGCTYSASATRATWLEATARLREHKSQTAVLRDALQCFACGRNHHVSQHLCMLCPACGTWQLAQHAQHPRDNCDVFECARCNLRGHMTHECPHPFCDTCNKGVFEPHCAYCHSYGHVADTCKGKAKTDRILARAQRERLKTEQKVQREQRARGRKECGEAEALSKARKAQERAEKQTQRAAAKEARTLTKKLD
jgi:hypothetical protein